jgi:hypothetical protein
VEPSISGNAVAGQTLTATPGTWTGTTPITFAYQWLKCDSGGANCNPIGGETGVARIVDNGDVGFRLRVRVTATNVSGSVAAESNATTVVTSSGSGPPVVQTEPSISGSAVQGQTLTGDKGAFTGAATITYAYQWLRCDTNGANCTAIAGETGTARTVDAGDVGSRLRFRVTATNGVGTATAQSNATAVVTGSGGGAGAPVNTALPTVTGTPAAGQALTASAGSWSGAAPITFTYQWLRCDANATTCSPIPGETTSTRVVDTGDGGFRLRVQVTAKNSAGSASAQSAATAAVPGGGGTGGGGTGGGGGPLPPGAVQLPGGGISIPVSSVSLPQQLIVAKVRFRPNPVRSRTAPITIEVRVLDTRGYAVRDVLVFVRSVPILTSTPPEQPTGPDGWARFTVTPRAGFPLRNGQSVQFFVRARKAGDDILVGVGSRRLVQLRTAR